MERRKRTVQEQQRRAAALFAVVNPHAVQVQKAGMLVGIACFEPRHVEIVAGVEGEKHPGNGQCRAGLIEKKSTHSD